ncbi:Hypothetical protein D9617_2g059480 [Elsinoe fawcettii]|nr:Hypothetical protein D9617_2g059480 [Elsinoe fawcettii]
MEDAHIYALSRTYKAPRPTEYSELKIRPKISSSSMPPKSAVFPDSTRSSISSVDSIDIHKARLQEASGTNNKPRMGWLRRMMTEYVHVSSITLMGL